jgi:hypothetical protein
MVSLHSLWNLNTVELKGDTVCEDGAPLSTNPAVSTVDGGRPQPALIGPSTIDLRPEALLERPSCVPKIRHA